MNLRSDAVPNVSAEVDGEWSTDFAEFLRHELNNPLTGILGNAELLLAEIARKKAASVRMEDDAHARNGKTAESGMGNEKRSNAANLKLGRRPTSGDWSRWTQTI